MKNAIIITGVSTGIGYELAKGFAQKGYQVFGSVRRLEDAGMLMDEFPDNFLPLVFDVTDYQAIDTAATEVKELLKGEALVGLINNSGIAVTGPLLQLPMDDFKRQFEVNLFGLVKVTQAFLPLLGASEGFSKTPGRIINISSAAGQIGFPFMAPYCGSKHAVEGVSESLRRELLHLGIKVIIVGPTAIKTPIWEKEGIEVHENVRKGIFGKQVANFIYMFSKSGEKAMPVTEFAQKVVSIFEKKNPKARYAISANKLEEWFMPRFMPTKTVDKNISKMLNR